MERDPHAVIEGMLIAAWAVQAKWSCTYIRGEYAFPYVRMQRAVEEAYKAAVDSQRAAIWETMTEQERQRAEERVERFAQEGAPADLARDVGALAPLVAALDVADLAERTRWPVAAAAQVFRSVGAAFGIDRLRGAAANFVLEQHWDRLALRRTLEELYEDQRMLAEAVIRHAGAAPKSEDVAAPSVAVRTWMSANDARVTGVLATIAELEATGGWTFAKTILAAAEVRGLSTAAAQHAA